MAGFSQHYASRFTSFSMCHTGPPAVTHTSGLGQARVNAAEVSQAGPPPFLILREKKGRGCFDIQAPLIQIICAHNT